MGIRRLFTKKRLIVLIIVLIIIIVGFVIITISSSNKSSVVSATVQRGDVKEELSISGKIDAGEHVVLQFPSTGKVLWVGVKKGDYIKKYQAVASIDKQNLEAAYRQAWQDFVAAKAGSDQYYDGHKNATESYPEKVTRTALDATQNKAYDDMRIAEENIKNATLYSPIEGLVTAADPSYAGVNLSLSVLGRYEIVNPKTIYFNVSADQADVVSLKEGMEGKIILESYPDTEITGVIKNINFTPKTDESGIVYEVKVEFVDLQDPDYKYRFGMTGDVTFITQERKNVLNVPTKFLKTDEKGKYVYVNKEKNQKVYVKTGLEGEETIEIEDSIAEGTVVYD